MHDKSAKDSNCLARCYGKLYQPHAKECAICDCSDRCKLDGTPLKHKRRSRIQERLIALLTTGPKTVEEVISMIRNDEKGVAGTSVFYHLGNLKKQGVLEIVKEDGIKKYRLFKEQT